MIFGWRWLPAERIMLGKLDSVEEQQQQQRRQ